MLLLVNRMKQIKKQRAQGAILSRELSLKTKLLKVGVKNYGKKYPLYSGWAILAAILIAKKVTKTPLRKSAVLIQLISKHLISTATQISQQ